MLWFVKTIEVRYAFDFSDYGVMPRTISGLRGILFSPFIHSSYDHLFSNIIPILVLGTMINFFFSSIWPKVYALLFVFSGIGLWLIGRENFHIGASGLVYAMAGFLFFSGMIRRDFKMRAISLIIVFLYGSLVWGMMPVLIKISWEGHLAGLAAGMVTAYMFKDDGPRKLLYQWEHDEIHEMMEGKQASHNDQF